MRATPAPCPVIARTHGDVRSYARGGGGSGRRVLLEGAWTSTVPTDESGADALESAASVETAATVVHVGIAPQSALGAALSRQPVVPPEAHASRCASSTAVGTLLRDAADRCSDIAALVTPSPSRALASAIGACVPHSEPLVSTIDWTSSS